MAKMTIKGIDEVMKNLNKALKQMQGTVTNAGFIKVAVAVRQSMNSQIPLIPVDTGNLRASFFTVIKGRGQVDMANPAPVKPHRIPAKHIAFQKTFVAQMNGLSQSKNYPNMIFGFSANYAAIVHEDMKPKNWNVPGSGPKFFQAHLERLQGEILRILSENIKTDTV